MIASTLLTMVGYLRSLFEKYTGVDTKTASIDGIYNYHLVSIGLNTSGQPTAMQFQAIKSAGTQVVINLAPASAQNALSNETEIIENLAMTYAHLPVDFSAPTEQNFKDFCELLDAHKHQQLWVHCAANMRVSAFVYRYRCEVLGHEPQQALNDLSVIWEPFGVWRRFIAPYSMPASEHLSGK